MKISLCYIDAPWAYFTTQPLSEQREDEWHKPGYEHNARRPRQYDPRADAGRERWEIIRVAFSGDFLAPCDGHTNSPWSVNAINAGQCPWLRQDVEPGITPVVIPAGVDIETFCRLIADGGGTAYVPASVRGLASSSTSHQRFRDWWHRHGSAMYSIDGEDAEEHAERVAAAAWAIASTWVA